MQAHLRHLANFAFIVEAGSITAAAKKLEVSPSVLSESVKTLEAHLGTALLERRRSGVAPTSRGLEIYEPARAIVDAAQDALRPAPDKAAGRVRISLPTEVATFWCQRALRQIAEDLPDVHVTLMCEDKVLAVERSSRDLYINITNRPKDRGMTVLATTPTRPVFVATPDLAAAPDIADVPLVCAPRATEAVEMRGVNFKRTLQASSIVTRIALIRAGLGVGGCLEQTVREDLASGKLVEVLGSGSASSAVAAISSPLPKPTRTVRAAAEILATALGA